ncbi:MAG: hypothetical protein KKB50_16780 [Planctomycetes bacterium]|nr:hypothetical protein [Planctomycetota bacterium]
MVVKPGGKIHAMTRRNFEADLRRHFIGEVVESAESAVQASGHVFVFDTASNQ